MLGRLERGDTFTQARELTLMPIDVALSLAGVTDVSGVLADD